MKRLKDLTAAAADSWGYPKVNIHEKDAERVYLYRGKFTLRLHIARKEFLRGEEEELIRSVHKQASSDGKILVPEEKSNDIRASGNGFNRFSRFRVDQSGALPCWPRKWCQKNFLQNLFSIGVFSLQSLEHPEQTKLRWKTVNSRKHYQGFLANLSTTLRWLRDKSSKLLFKSARSFKRNIFLVYKPIKNRWEEKEKLFLTLPDAERRKKMRNAGESMRENLERFSEFWAFFTCDSFDLGCASGEC